MSDHYDPLTDTYVVDGIHIPGHVFNVGGMRVKLPTDPPVIFSETRITDPLTGGQKGAKASQISQMHPEALMALGRVCEFGGRKYERYNYMKGYAWSLSYDACQRHLMKFWGGQDIDEDEDGIPGSKESHLLHAAWHCLVMYLFWRFKRGTDDRPPSSKGYEVANAD